MNCESAQQSLLLAASIELSAAELAALRAHVSECAACRAYEADVGRVMTVFRSVQLDRDVRTETLMHIESEAQRLLRPASRRRIAKAPSFFDLWQPALVYSAAAVLLILVAVSVIRRNATELADSSNGSALAWNAAFDAELDDVFDLLVLAEGDAADSSGQYDTLEDIADELLELEDWQI